MTSPEIPVHVSGGSDIDVGTAVARLYDLTHHLRVHCPWDIAQTAGTIVPHTLEETYEVVDVVRAIERGDVDVSDADLEDELGDLLFQVSFLAMWLEERDSSIDLGTVATRIHEKLVRRHPHVFGDEVAAGTADEVRGAWEQVKREREQRGLFEGIPRAMPALGRARKIQSRAAGVGFEFDDAMHALEALESEVRELRLELERAAAAGTLPTGESTPPDARVESELGDVFVSAVNVARMTRVDPELATSDAIDRFRARLEQAMLLASTEGSDWTTLPLDAQEAYYQRAKAVLTPRQP